MASWGEWIEQIKIKNLAGNAHFYLAHLEALSLPAVPVPAELLPSPSPVKLCQCHLWKVILLSRLLCIQSTGATGWAGCPAESLHLLVVGWGEIFLDFGCLGIFLTILQSCSAVSLIGLTNYSSISNGGRWHVWGGCFFWGHGPLVAELSWSLEPGGSFQWAAAGHVAGVATAFPALSISDLSSYSAFTDVGW